MSNSRSTRQVKKASPKKDVGGKAEGPPPVSDRGVMEAMRNEITDLVQQVSKARENKLYLVARITDLEAENATLKAALAELDATPKT